jgi:hypothetical protein
MGGDQVVVQTLQMAHRILLRSVVEKVRALQVSLVSF